MAYNQTVLFKKEYELKQAGKASLRITADSWYRVLINGKWVHDGPGKGYPNHFQYDTHDVGKLLKSGKNQIEIIARYYGIGTFHQIPQQAGLWAELKLGNTIMGTDSTWQASPSKAWKQWVPKASIQMEPVEEYDARLEKDLDWQAAIEVKRSGRLTARQVGLLTKVPRKLSRLYSAIVTKRSGPCYTVPVAQLAHPGAIEANGHTTRPVILISTLHVRTKQQFDFAQSGQKDDFLNPSGKNWRVAVNGKILKSGRVILTAGHYPVLFICASFLGHEKDLAFPWLNITGGTWSGWKVAVLDEFLYRDDDRLWFAFPHAKIDTLRDGYFQKAGALAALCKSKIDPELEASCRELPLHRVFMADFAVEFAHREPLASADRLFDGKLIKPSSKGDVELCFDLGEQSCGYFDFTIRADAGVVVDINAIEYIREDGVLQHVQTYNRNGMRYITKTGINRFTSLKRRSGQYFFITLRNQKTPVELRKFQLIESTAPVEPVGSFECSDPMLNRIWQISEHTLKLCMEDTFTDCPLYEQTLWIGDARNEALYAFTAYGSYDVSARSLELGAQSLDRFPIVGCQVPSSWNCILPAWSFLWGMHVWEHCFYSGDRKLLHRLWPAVLKNIDGALGMLNENGLFSGLFWNLIEWAPIDQDQPTVLHNSMLLVGALRAAENCADVLKDEAVKKRLIAVRRKLVKAIQKTWNEQNGSYPDSIHADGSFSPKTCQHTSMFPIMFDMIPKGGKEALRQNLLNPPKEMTTVGAPFAMQFLYEAMEGLGEMDAVLDSIRGGFKPMVEAGASTVWETFANSTCSPKGFPTRSHCHAWSSSPIYFLNRIVLGIRQVKPGGKAFEISPWITGLSSARGAAATPNGPIHVEWKIQGTALQIHVNAPRGVWVGFKPNVSHHGLTANMERNEMQ